MAWQVAVVFLMAPWWLEHHHEAPFRLIPGDTNCRDWIYVPACASRPVQADAQLAIAVLTAIFFVQYCFYLLKSWRQLKQLPCVEARPARINFSLQVGSAEGVLLCSCLECIRLVAAFQAWLSTPGAACSTCPPCA